LSQDETLTSRAVVTGIVAISKQDETLAEAGAPRFWPGVRSLPLNRVSSLVMLAGERLLGPQEAAGVDAESAVVLGTTYGSQACHERIWRALANGGPRAVNPNDFALSTFNAPGAALASAYGFGGANLVFLGANGGSAAIDEGARLIAGGRAQRVAAGAYEEVTPYFARVLAAQGEPDVSEAIALMMLEGEVSARERGATVLATILGQASRAPAGHWPNATELTVTLRIAMEQVGLKPDDVGAVIVDSHTNTRDAQVAAVESVFGRDLTVIDVGPRYGNCLAASAPLAVHASIEAACAGSWPCDMVLRGRPAFVADEPVLILSCGLMSGCAALLVQPHGRP
jgi:3-oxoacyl-(acyl-carrier-protein) synthase